MVCTEQSAETIKVLVLQNASAKDRSGAQHRIVVHTTGKSPVQLLEHYRYLDGQDVDQAHAGYHLSSSKEIRRHRSRSLDERMF